VGCRRDGDADGVVLTGPIVRVLVAACAALLVIAGIGALVVHSQPVWYLRVRYPLAYEQTLRAYARERGLDPSLVAAVVYAESRFDPDARSDAGAVGLMQVLPGTGEFIARSTGGDDFVVSDLRKPDLNVRYGTWLLAYLRDHYHGDMRLALAAYHAGQANVDEWLRDDRGIVFPETRAYVDEVERVRQVYASAYRDELGLR
jgi:soluble lytic murein transglycosylase